MINTMPRSDSMRFGAKLMCWVTALSCEGGKKSRLGFLQSEYRYRCEYQQYGSEDQYYAQPLKTFFLFLPLTFQRFQLRCCVLLCFFHNIICDAAVHDLHLVSVL